MTPEEAQKLQVSGRYSELLEKATAERTRASIEANAADSFAWALVQVRACRFLGRAAEALDHAAEALRLAGPSAENRARALHARAIAFRCARRFDDALDDLQAAVDALPAQGNEGIRAASLLEQAETYLDAGLRPQAEAALSRGSALVHWLKEPRYLAWSLFLRSQLEDAPSPADLQLSAAYEISRTLDCPELQWQILWKLSDRAAQQGRAKIQEDCLWSALAILTKMASQLDPADATSFWRQGARRVFVDAVQKKFGAQFHQMVMRGEGSVPEDARMILKELGFDPATLPDYGRGPS